ncbi:MAG: exodeoxyribonuclease VII large subunit [Planctomycetes bacterium]|nr:exodeoxyribonuclease VII large subunit [Planctomycetota bacterium]
MAAQPDASLVPRSMTVSQLNALVKRVLVNGLPATIHLIGQVSNFTRHGSGHCYFTLKDDRTEIRAVMWRSTAAVVKFKIEDGLEVVATGSVDVYEPRGQYQFYVRKLEPKGVGELELAFRQLHDRLAREGLFDKARKRPIPRYPRRIAVVTSPTGAAIQDILHALRRRFCCAQVLFHPVRVQGEGAAQEIADAVGRLNDQSAALGGIDVMIVGRGGGSLEDLWAFNEEVVARAVHASRIPIISGVGHEVDVTIADLVADLRAPTPTAAAELAVPVLADVLETLDQRTTRLGRGIRHRLEMGRSQVDSLRRTDLFRNPLGLVRRAEQQVDEWAGRLRHGSARLVLRTHRRLDGLQLRLLGVRPAVLVRDRQARLVALDHRLQSAVQRWCRQAERRIETASRALLAASPAHRVAMHAGKLREYRAGLARELTHRLRLLRTVVDSLASRLEATSYRRTLARGFSVTWDERRGRIVLRAADLAAGQVIVTEMVDGDVRSRVET